MKIEAVTSAVRRVCVEGRRITVFPAANADSAGMTSS